MTVTFDKLSRHGGHRQPTLFSVMELEAEVIQTATNFTVNKVLFTTRVIERKRWPFLALNFNVNYEISLLIKERCFKDNDLL